MTALSPELPLWHSHVSQRFGVVMSTQTAAARSLLAAIRSAALEAGCALTVTDTGDNAERKTAAIQELRADRVDGVLIVPDAGDDPVITALVRMGVPTVLMGRTTSRTDVDQVSVENVDAMCTLVRHLADRRHRRIGLISGGRGQTASDERIRGYRLGLGRAGLRWNNALVVCGESTPGGAAAATAKLLDGWPSPTALVAASEAMLIGVQYELHRRGIRIGDEVAVVAFGDASWARDVDSPLTTMAEPITEIGRKAMHLLLTKIATRSDVPETVRLAPRFEHRASCGC